MKNPQKGDLLISEPFLPDPNFERTVVLLCEHNEEGSFGFIINKPSMFKISELVEELESLNAPIYVGGPVQQDSIHFIHRNDLLEGGVEVTNGLYWGGNFEHLTLLSESSQLSESNFRFFMGYSGWGPEQLQQELNDNSWIIYENATLEQIFDTSPDNLWRQVLKDMGGKYKMFSNYPLDPRLN